MRDFVITVNSTVDLPREWLEERHVPVFRLNYRIAAEQYPIISGRQEKGFLGKREGGSSSGPITLIPKEGVT